MKKGTRGYILAYSVVLMTFVMMLIAAIVTMLSTTTRSNNQIFSNIHDRTEIDQMGEFFVREEYWKLESDSFDVDWRILEDDTRTLTVRDILGVRLYVEVRDEQVRCWIYGEKE